MTAANEKDQQPEGINKRRLVVSLLAMPVYFALFLFLPAGTWAWAKGWLFTGVFLGTLAVAAGDLRRRGGPLGPASAAADSALPRRRLRADVLGQPGQLPGGRRHRRRQPAGRLGQG